MSPGNDGHTSFFNWSWLRRHSYDPKFIDTHKILNVQTLWNAGIKDCPPIVQYIDVMKTKEGLASLLKNINEFGFSFIDGVPHAVKETEELARQICFIRETHYGSFWDFRADLEHGDTAYTNLPLRAHTDNTYFTDPSGLQMFHLIEFNGEGGSSLLVDGFYVARQLKMKSPTAYETLSTITIPAHSAGDPNTLIQPTPNGYPILNHDPLLDNSLYQIRYNNDDRSTMNHLEPDQVLEFYDALRKWNSLLKDKSNEYWFQLKPGRAVIFDNWRVLHGRDKYSGHRRLIGCYLNWDDYQSRLKVSYLSQEEILESL
ncbi:23868_t:CDS:2 [Dentiscutata erythropus]|uniref:23868_t:CDS:1 n=1 Tax=Dentiscutata erythropus TaxID=1348616 RepID=A0A9N9NE90_9GLOM|nr:23868_t:CDS:2 [Dentiscutata erythropus]